MEMQYNPEVAGEGKAPCREGAADEPHLLNQMCSLYYESTGYSPAVELIPPRHDAHIEPAYGTFYE